MMRTKTVLPTVPALALIAVLSGCSGGGGSSAGGVPLSSASPPPPASGGSPPPIPPPPPGLPTANGDTGGGHWWGVLTRDGEVVNDAMCLIVESGDLACFFIAPPEQRLSFDNTVAALYGNVQISETTTASGSGKFYATPGQVLTDGTSVVADFTITGGALTSDNSLIELTFASLGEESTFYGYYDHYYKTEGQAFLWPADGVYTAFDIYGDPASLTIHQNGTLFLQTASGCAGNGQMINIDPQQVRGQGGYNAYTVDVTISNCAGLNGNFEGLATLTDFSWVNGTDDLVIAVFNETTAIFGQAVK
jgi:hypothetical protein